MAQRRVARHHASADYHRWLLALIFGAAALSLMSGPVASIAHALVGALSASPKMPTLVWSVSALGVVGAATLAFRLRSRQARGRGARITWRWRPRLEWTDPARTLEALRALTPTEFELEVGAFLRRCGYRDVRHTGCAGDLAADLICVDARGARVVVQCKRYGPGSAVTSPEMQMFIGMIYAHHQADYGVFVTTSTFTRPARALAEQHGIRLLDGASLSARLRRAA